MQLKGRSDAFLAGGGCMLINDLAAFTGFISSALQRELYALVVNGGQIE